MEEINNKRTEASRLLENNVKTAVGVGNKYRTLAELAEAMKVTAPSLTNALKGNPRLETIQKIADALGVSVAVLFEDRTKKTVEGFAIIGGTKNVAFASVEELEMVLAEAKEPKNGGWNMTLKQ